jgi:hypothetical protein
MNWRQWIIFVLLIGYVVAAGRLTIYHAYNFSNLVHVKGDETFDYIKYLLWTSIIFQGLIWIITRTLDWKTAIVATIGNTIISFILGFIIIMASGLSGIPRHLIFVYGACFMTIFALVTIKQIRKLKKN